MRPTILKLKFRIIAVIILALLFGVSSYAKTVRILAIGNSFSQEAVEQYLHQIGAAEDIDVIIGNLFIGGCSLKRHATNAANNTADYAYRKIGSDGIKKEFRNYTIGKALEDEPWDYISLQQVSGDSGLPETYEPWLSQLIAYVKEKGPKKAKLMFHQTWSYAKDTNHGAFPSYDRDQDKMYHAVVKTTKDAAKRHGIKIIIPSGTAIQNGRTSFVGDNFNRDGYHLDITLGRYTAACTWAETVLGIDTRQSSYLPDNINPELAQVARQAAHAAALRPFEVTSLSEIFATAETELYKDPKVPVEIRVRDLLSRMSLQEKIMQLNQYTLGKNNNPNNAGLVADIPATIGSLISFEEDAHVRNIMQRRAIEETRLGIPIIFAYDVIHGFRTVYPISLAQACSWDKDLTKRLCSMAAAESRTSGIEWVFSPMIDVARDPRWGRVSEGYGEDPYANAVFGAASVAGYQGKDYSDSLKVAACLKHYVAYGASEAGRDYVYTEVSPQTLWDTYLPAYEKGISCGAASVMSSFNDISGTPGSANHYTLTEILKDKWSFKGPVVSDWAAVAQLISQGYSPDKRQAAKSAINAGVDIDMMSNAYDKYLQELVESDDVDMQRLDDAVARILRIKFETGLFEHPYTPEIASELRILLPQSKDLALEAAQGSMVLLKNNDALLPIDFSGKKVALIGPLADNARDLLGNWAGHGHSEDVITIAQGLKQCWTEAYFSVLDGCGFEQEDSQLLDQAKEVAQNADVVVLCLGEKFNWSGENASRSTISLPQAQIKLAQELARLGKPTILLLVNGRPLDLTALEPISDAIIEMWQPGIMAGPAIASILSGDVNPSARLAITFPRADGQIPIYYNRRKSARSHQGLYQDISSEPLYPFGYGLSYTTFEYGDITASATEVGPKDKLHLEVTVTNTGEADGQEPVLWYVSDPYCSITRPVKELKHFQKQMIPAGESRRYSFDVNLMRDFGYVNPQGERFLEPGEYYVWVGDKSVKITLIDK